MHENRNLVRRILAGETHAFERLIRNYQRLVSHIVFRMVTNQADREDICQDVFIKVYQNLSNFRFDSKLSTWIAKIAFNRCVNFLEKKKVPLFDDIADQEKAVERYAGDDPGPDEYTQAGDLKKLLQREIDKLPIQYRTIITLYHLDEMSYTEIGKITGLPDGTVKSYLFRARKALKQRLEAKYQPEELWK